jgi:phage tail protein X
MRYITVLGDTWDLIAKKVYGDEFYADKLMDANRDLLNNFVFSEGIAVECPKFETKTAEHPAGYPEWRT